MSLELSHSSPMGITVSIAPDLLSALRFEHPEGKWDFAVSMEEFCQVMMYALTNTDLHPGDPRLKFMNDLAELCQVQGYNGPNSRRLGFVEPVPTSRDVN